MAERRNKSLVIPLSTGATLLVSGFLAGGQHVPVHIQLGPGPLLGFRDRPVAADLRRLPLRPGSLESADFCFCLIFGPLDAQTGAGHSNTQAGGRFLSIVLESGFLISSEKKHDMKY